MTTDNLQSIPPSFGKCGCGCGQQTTIIKQTSVKRGLRKGQPHRFVVGHNTRKYPTPTKYQNANAKSRVHPFLRPGNQIGQHVIIAERALEKRLPLGALVHHVNSLPGDNRNQNLVICQDQGYHRLIHMRTKALQVCGNANFAKCKICKRYDDPKTMTKDRSQLNCYVHRECHTQYERERRHRKDKIAA